jgi:hypothetical protein
MGNGSQNLTTTINMSLRNNMNAARLINDIRRKSDHPLFSIVEMLPEAVEHTATVLDPSHRPISEELYEQIQLFKQNIDAMLADQWNDTEYSHYCYYVLYVRYFVGWVQG